MRTTALIVTYNRREKLQQCWAATAAQPFSHIVIIDNASTDETASWLSTLTDPRLQIITSESNSGGAGGFLRGAQYIVEHLDTDWVFFYDDDAYPAYDLLDMFSYVSGHDYPVYCCQVRDSNQQLCRMNIPYRRWPRTFVDNIRYLINQHDYLPDPEQACDVLSLSFVGAILHISVLQKNLKTIFPQLFIYYDDLYFSYLLSQQGYLIRYSPELQFTHDVPPALNYISPEWKVYYLIRNLLLVSRLMPQRPCYTWGAIMLRIGKYFFAVHKQPAKWPYFRYCLKGIKDGILGISGKQH